MTISLLIESAAASSSKIVVYVCKSHFVKEIRDNKRDRERTKSGIWIFCGADLIRLTRLIRLHILRLPDTQFIIK
jgi:hypothetical protein